MVETEHHLLSPIVTYSSDIAPHVAKNIGWFPQTDCKTPLLKIIPIQFIEQGEVNWCLHRAFTPMVQEGPRHKTRRENTNPAPNPLI